MNTLRLPKTHFILMLVLPLAVVLGYFLVDPLEPSSLTVFGLVLGALAVPLVMQWYHPALILFWNASAALIFLPGTPHVWMLIAFLGFAIAVLNRSVSSEFRFVSAPGITRPLLFLLAVVFITAFLTGGIGAQSLGSSTRYGGRRYAYVAMAVVGYFALTSQRIPERRAALFTSMFFLSSLTALVPDILGLMGSRSSLLYLIFPPDFTAAQAVSGEYQNAEIFRIFGLTAGSIGLFSALLAKFGLRGILDLSRPWRFALFMLAVLAGVYSGFRGVFIYLGLLFCIQFWLEGLHRTIWLGIMAAAILIGGAIVLPFADRLPMTVQRSISVLPIRVSLVAAADATASSEWRVNLWKSVLPTVPQHLLLGTGYNINPSALYFSTDTRTHGEADWAIFSGDYHSGPLSVVMPFGFWGVAAFGWFCLASIRFLHSKLRHGSPKLQRINTFIFVCFVTKLIVFLVVFGSFWSDLFAFTGLMGLSASLNGPEPVKELPQTAEVEEDSLPCAYRDDYA